MDIYKWYKASRVLYLHHIPLFPAIIKTLLRIIWGGVIPYQADIGSGTVLGYQALGIVIHKRCVIGKNCHIGASVTIGGTSGLYEVPVLGDNVHVGAGAVIIGPIMIGSDVQIGANAVVNKSLPSGCTAVGVPARVIKEESPENVESENNK